MNRGIAESFCHCPLCGKAAAEPGRNPFRCSCCGHTHYFSPIVAVAGIVTDDRGQVLLLQRARDPGAGQFGLPGGFVDPGETAEAALIREVREEVNLNVTRLDYLTSLPNLYNYRGFESPVTDFFYLCEVASLESLAADPSEVAGCRFCHPGPDELQRMAFASNRHAVELFLKR